MQRQIRAMGMSSGNRNGKRIMQTIVLIKANIASIIAPIMGSSKAKIQKIVKMTMAQIPKVQPAAVATIVIPSRGISKKCQQSKMVIKISRKEIMVFEVLFLLAFNMMGP